MSLLFRYPRQIITFVVSVVLSVLLVSTMAFATTYLAVSSIGIGTSSPGAALGVKGAVLVDDFVLANSFTATSSGSVIQWENGDATTTSYALDVGGFGNVKGNWNIEATSTAGSFIATSSLGVGTTSISTAYDAFAVVGGGIFTNSLGVGVATSATGGFVVKGSAEDLFIIDPSASGLMGIATDTFPSIPGDVAATISVGAGSASSTLFLSGGAAVGSGIILQSSNGSGCVLIVANRADADADGNVPLVGRVTGCPLP